jgi:hypothetical protein
MSGRSSSARWRREKALGPEHPDTARGLNNLAGLLQDQGDLAAARPLFERSLANPDGNRALSLRTSGDELIRTGVRRTIQDPESREWPSNG